MEKKKALDSLNPIPNQQKNIDSLFAEAQYLNQEQSLALDDPSKMTEEIFNSIQLRRMEVGYADRLERAINRPSSSIPNGTLGINTKYEKMRQNILFEFGYDIGFLD